MKLFSLLAASDKLLEGLIVAVIVLAAIGVIALAVVLIVGNRAAKNRKTNAKTPVQQTPSQPKPKAEPFKPEIIQKPTNNKVVGAMPVAQPVEQPQVDDNEVLVRYSRSFVSKLMQADEEVKGYYSEVVNHALGYKKVKNRVSWPCSTLNCSREKLAIMLVKGKTLYLYLALDPSVAKETIKGTLKDVSTKKRFSAVPTLFKVKSTLSLRKAKVLIDKMMETKGIAFDKVCNKVSPQDFPALTMDELIQAGHIKVRSVDGKAIDESKTLRTAGFNVVSSVTAEQAHDMISDEVASTLVQKAQNASVRTGKKFPVNIDTLCQKFESGEMVTLDTLKVKGVVPKKETAIKVLARGTLDKALVVEADAFSLDAIKMIVLVGGTAIKK